MTDIKQMLIGKIKQANFTKGQKAIAEFIVRNPEQISLCTAKELADKIGISDASLIRFSRTIGYDGYAALKDDVCQSLATIVTGKSENLSLTERIHDKPSANIQEEYLKVAQNNLQQTFQQNDKRIMEKAVNRILKAKHHYIVGFRGCAMIAAQMTFLLRFFVNHVLLINDSGPSGMDMIHDAGPDDVVVFYGVKRYYNSDKRIMEIAHHNKAKVCLITDSIAPPFAEPSDIILLANTNQVSFFNSMNSICAITECLVAMIGKDKHAEFMKWTKVRDTLTEEMRK